MGILLKKIKRLLSEQEIVIVVRFDACRLHASLNELCKFEKFVFKWADSVKFIYEGLLVDEIWLCMFSKKVVYVD